MLSGCGGGHTTGRKRFGGLGRLADSGLRRGGIRTTLRKAVLYRFRDQAGNRNIRGSFARQHIRDEVRRHQIGRPQFRWRQFMELLPRRNAERQRQQITGAAHIEGVFGERPMSRSTIIKS